MSALHIKGFHAGALDHPGIGAFEPNFRPTPSDQLVALNRALTAEVLRHAETRQALGDALLWGWLVRETVRPVEIVREVPLRFTRHVPWVPGNGRTSSLFPLALAERTGLAAVIQRPVRLRSGAELDPVKVEVRRGNTSAVFPDSSWLVLCLMVRGAGAAVSSADLALEIFGSGAGNSVRSAVHRTRVALAVVNAESDLELAKDRKSGWRLLLAEKR